MNEYLIIQLAEMYNKRNDDGKDGFLLIKFAVPLKIFNELYERLSKIDVPPIESLPVEEKIKYWDIAKRYHETEPEAIKASKAAYILALITNTN